ncbi:Rhs-family protein [hydrothermal vent metagenome]|uniref:Rhs-family protein n=1 Tax=hydrothermal vent metagenome TaxID=652676 RepID=A0A3B0XTJ4_9ZZZZ
MSKRITQLAQETRNKIKKTYVYEPLSFKPVALVQDNEVYHYHLDHLGTPRELTNDAGDIVWKVRYKSWGNVALKECEEIENNIRFQGQYYDEESGLHYNRHRYYSPDSGQFITQDPIGLMGGVNNYQYTPNPIGWVDPFGLCKEQKVITDPAYLLAAPSALTPEMPNAPITSVILPAGFKFSQAISPNQRTLGKFWTTDIIPDIDYVRNELAVIPSFKKKISSVREIEITRPVRAQLSTVGPQEENGIFYSGGGSQIDVLEYDPYDPFVKFADKPEKKIK